MMKNQASSKESKQTRHVPSKTRADNRCKNRSC
jgi:hypothetical protein